MSSVRLGLLDIGYRESGAAVKDSLNATIQRAVLAESLGYTRYWLGEHHAMTDTWGQPQIPIALAANATRKIRIGSGSVLLRAYNPLHVANDYALLSSSFEWRIDLGIGGGLPRTYAQLIHPQEPASVDYERKVRELLALLDGSIEPGVFEANHVVPSVHAFPLVWLTGTSLSSALLAASLGLPYAYSIFHSDDVNLDALAAYRAKFTPSPRLDRPFVMVAAAGTCARTAQKARDTAEEMHGKVFMYPRVIGDGNQCAAGLRQISEATKADEMMYLDIAPAPEQRMEATLLLNALIG